MSNWTFCFLAGLEGRANGFYTYISHCTEGTQVTITYFSERFINHSLQASCHVKLQHGQALLAVGDQSLLGIGFDAVLEALRNSKRPMVLKFGVPSDVFLGT